MQARPGATIVGPKHPLTMEDLARRAAREIKLRCKLSPGSTGTSATYEVEFRIDENSGKILAIVPSGEDPAVTGCISARVNEHVPTFSGAVNLTSTYKHSYTVIR